MPVACVPTGEKHLHHAAQNFDVGVYFEANGHGTAVFKQEAEDRIRKEATAGNQSAQRLTNVIDVINQVLESLFCFVC